MSLWEKRAFNLFLVTVASSGIVHLVTKYAIEQTDPFSVVNHPLQPISLAVHVLSTPLLVLLAGMMAASHVKKMVRTRGPGKLSSGLSAVIAFLVMLPSGYLLQVLVDPWLRKVMVVLHVASSLIFLTAYSAHAVTAAFRRWRRGESRTWRMLVRGEGSVRP